MIVRIWIKLDKMQEMLVLKIKLSSSQIMYNEWNIIQKGIEITSFALEGFQESLVEINTLLIAELILFKSDQQLFLNSPLENIYSNLVDSFIQDKSSYCGLKINFLTGHSNTVTLLLCRSKIINNLQLFFLQGWSCAQNQGGSIVFLPDSQNLMC